MEFRVELDVAVESLYGQFAPSHQRRDAAGFARRSIPPRAGLRGSVHLDGSAPEPAFREEREWPERFARKMGIHCPAASSGFSTCLSGRHHP